MKPWRKTILCLFLVFWQIAATAEDDRFILHEQPTSRWTIDCNVTAPATFAEDVRVYQYTQQDAASEVNTLNRILQAESCVSLSLTADPNSKSLAFANRSPCMLTIPAKSSVEGLTIAQDQLLHALMTDLEAADFHPAQNPYAVMSLQSVLDRSNVEKIGRIQDWNAFVNGIKNENQIDLKPDTVYIILVPAIDGYPIDPRLYGRHTDSDVPMYALLLFHDNDLMHMETGCSYIVTGQKHIKQPLVSWTDAVHTAIQSITSQWIPAWEAMSNCTDGGYDYPTFFAAYDPEFLLRVCSVEGMYYATENELRPGWKVTFAIGIHLKNDDALTSSERHRYVWEQYITSCMIDAETGEHVQ